MDQHCPEYLKGVVMYSMKMIFGMSVEMLRFLKGETTAEILNTNLMP